MHLNFCQVEYSSVSTEDSHVIYCGAFFYFGFKKCNRKLFGKHIFQFYTPQNLQRLLFLFSDKIFVRYVYGQSYFFDIYELYHWT